MAASSDNKKDQQMIESVAQRMQQFADDEKEMSPECLMGFLAAEDMAKCIGKKAVILGRYRSGLFPDLNVDGVKHIFTDGEGALFTVLTPQPDFAGFADESVVEIEGRIVDEDTILMTHYKDWGRNANLNLWKKLVKYTKQFPGLF